MSDLSREQIEELKKDGACDQEEFEAICSMALRLAQAERELKLVRDTSLDNHRGAHRLIDAAEARAERLEAALRKIRDNAGSVHILETINEALASTRAAARETTDEEIREWCERVYREVGVTPALRKAYEFYRQHMPLHSLGGRQDCPHGSWYVQGDGRKRWCTLCGRAEARERIGKPWKALDSLSARETDTEMTEDLATEPPQTS